MKKGFYLKLAVDGMRKNRKLYLPYLFTCILMVLMLYLISYLSMTKALQDMPGSETLSTIMTFGVIVLGVFALLFLFYTNAFLVRRRMKEYGLYNMLGMGKRDLKRLLFCETALTYGLTVLVGLVFGIGFSKLGELLLVNIVKGIVRSDFRIRPGSVCLVLIIFAVIFGLLYLNGLRVIRKSRAVELLKSEAVGEKPPRSKWVPGILGILLLGIAYYLAVAIEEPIEALFFFLIAVILVIIGIYLVFIAGSVLLCRQLQKNKTYYYNRKHFVPVSQMTYRMKRNGAGLASICILMTMVLVIISSTTTLYMGHEDCMRNQYPKEVDLRWMQYGYDDPAGDIDTLYTAEVDAVIDGQGVTPKDARHYEEYTITGYLEDSNVQIILNSRSNLAFIDYSKVCEVHFIDIEDYNRIYGQDYELKPGEALVQPVRTNDLGDVLQVADLSYKVKERLPKGSIDLFGSGDAAVSSAMFVFLPDMKESVRSLNVCKDYDGGDMLCHCWYYEFDPAEAIADTDMQDLITALRTEMSRHDHWNLTVESMQLKSSDFYGTFGGLLFLGAMLSVVFLLAAVLIIYYKQVSEGYEDRARFQIMQKVGMTNADIKRSINTQVRILFIMPIAFACLNLAFAFPFLNKLLILFGLMNMRLLITVTALTALVIAVIYAAAYRLTSNAYYRLVVFEA